MKKIISHHSCGVPNEDEDNNRPPTPWARSKSKQNIIDNLKDKNSDIRLLIGDYDNNLKLERVAGTQQSTGEKKTRVQNFYHMRRRQRKKMTTEQSITRRED